MVGRRDGVVGGAHRYYYCLVSFFYLTVKVSGGR